MRVSGHSLAFQLIWLRRLVYPASTIAVSVFSLDLAIAHLEQQLVNVCQRTTSSPIVPDDVEPVPKGDRQKQLKSAKAK